MSFAGFLLSSGRHGSRLSAGIPGWSSMVRTTSPRLPLSPRIHCERAFLRRAAPWSSARPATRTFAASFEVLLPCFDTIIATRSSENPRSVPPESIADQVVAMAAEAVRIAPGRRSSALARELTDSDGLICVTGSLFLAAEARTIITWARPPTVIHPRRKVKNQTGSGGRLAR